MTAILNLSSNISAAGYAAEQCIIPRKAGKGHLIAFFFFPVLSFLMESWDGVGSSSVFGLGILERIPFI